ncbi:GrpB family protein [Paenalkalicoccus suaedae]|uniref:GrpB family protein n=1 Tax=Paenalkalicoccus suaedae TaxID=2592382 RepID=A0A859FDT1_9BACI|nr:GrpB family protein [Paenalkalicoccus suaedae]QKS70386.1 GrpB family protein [Paenalkalicoccus suaedae]
MRKVIVTPYNKQWTEEFSKEAKALHQALGQNVTHIHHIGSTSVDGLSAKPIIDFLIEVKDVEEVDRYNTAMSELNYIARGENGIPNRRFFMKGEMDRTHHVHVFEEGSEHVERHLAFRDYLREFHEVKRAYGTLKEQLAALYPDDIEAYINGKASFVIATEKQALEWYRR